LSTKTLVMVDISHVRIETMVIRVTCVWKLW
jgi:hypothetical protein